MIRMLTKLLYMMCGVLFSWLSFDYISSSSNPYLGAVMGIAVLAFWIGTLKVIFRGGISI